MNCPSCGAPAGDANTAQCEYCGTALTTIACPSCFASMFAGMQFCPHCGARGSRTLMEGATLPCPGCEHTMQAVRVGATPMFECSACASVWLDVGTFSQMCSDREERGAVAAQITRAPVGVVPSAATRIRYVRCPVCRNMLNRENFGRQSGVVIDVCKTDGAWFERGELHSVLVFIESGGLERSRVAEAARRTEERQALEQQFTSLRIARETHTYSTKVSVSFDTILGDALKSLFS